MLFQLAISPQPKNPNEPILIQNSSQLSIKVEGVVQHGSRPGLYRKVDKILITVSSQQSRTPQQETKVIFLNIYGNNKLNRKGTCLLSHLLFMVSESTPLKSVAKKCELMPIMHMHGIMFVVVNCSAVCYMQ